MASRLDDQCILDSTTSSMRDALATHAERRRGRYGWMVGRLIVPSWRLAELDEAMRSLDPLLAGADETETAWRFGVLGGSDIASDATPIDAFHRDRAAFADGFGAAPFIDGLDVMVGSAREVHNISDLILSPLRVWFEVTPRPEPEEILRAAVRMGNSVLLNLGDNAGSIPSADVVATFLLAALRIGVFCNAKGSLVRAVRGSYPLPSATDGPDAVMHGFLNLFLAATLARELLMQFRPEGEALEVVAELLDEADAERIVWQDDGVMWRDYKLSLHAIESTRRWFARSFRPRSFDIAIDDLLQLAIL